MTSLSVLVCTYNRHAMLAQALDALIRRTIEKPDQVIVVNGGDAGADQVVHQFAASSSIQVVLVKTVNRNLAASRNIGLPYCTGDIVAMTDDDAEVRPNWVTQIKRVHAEHPEAGAVGGAVIGASSRSSLLSRLSDIVTFPSSSKAQYVRTLPGVNVSYKKEALSQIGPQDEALFRGEDVDFNWRVLQAGYRVFYDPSIRVLHHHRLTLRRFLQQHYMYGRAYYLVRRKWPAMYCVYPHQISTLRDVLKAGYFLVAIIHQPISAALQLPDLRDRLMGLPILVANQLAWRSGMVSEWWLQATHKDTGSDADGK